jgi:hypothetical protein
MKRNATRSVAREGPRRAALVAVTNGRLDGRRRKRVLVKIVRLIARHGEGKPGGPAGSGPP